MSIPTASCTTSQSRASRTSGFGFGWPASIAICLPLMLLSALLLTPRQGIALSPLQGRLASGCVWLLINGLFLAMIRTGRTDQYRRILFVTTAVAFALTFMPNLLQVRGSMLVERADMVDGHIPMCHIVIPMLLIPAALKQTIIFPGSLLEGFASIGSMLVLWLGATLALGRGWCSWICFYGGFDEGCSRLAGRSWVRRIDPRWTYLPVAVLFTVMLLSAASLSPTYCEWVCPFRAVSEFEKVTTAKLALQSAIFAALFLTFVIVLPILTGKRTQCALLCPMGVFQGWTNRFTLHRVSVDGAKCTSCGLCVRECPTLSITRESLARGGALTSCTKCGRCVDTCPRGALSHHIKGTALRSRPRLARVLFLYPAMLLLSAVGGGMMTGALLRIFRLLCTGSML